MAIAEKLCLPNASGLHMASIGSAANKFRSVLAEKELDHLERMLRLSQAHGEVAHLNGTYWTARLTYVMEHFDLVAEQSRRVRALLSAFERASASLAESKEAEITGRQSSMRSHAA
jgi:hypothetical protein